MTTSDVKVTPGSGANVATYDISEDAETKKIQRVGLNSLNGVDLTDATGIKISTSQLATISMTAQAMSVGYQLVGTPTDQVVANKLQAQTSGATSTRILSVATTPAATSIKASAGALIEIDVFNIAAYDVAVKFWNLATGSVTVGSTAPAWTIPLKAGTGYSRDFKYGKYFSTAITYTVTKLIGDSDATAVAAGDVTGTIDWI